MRKLGRGTCNLLTQASPLGQPFRSLIPAPTLAPTARGKFPETGISKQRELRTGKSRCGVGTGVCHILNPCLPRETTAASHPQHGDDILPNVTQGEKTVIETTCDHQTSLICVRKCNIADIWVWVCCSGLPVFKSQSGFFSLFVFVHPIRAAVVWSTGCCVLLASEAVFVCSLYNYRD